MASTSKAAAISIDPQTIFTTAGWHGAKNVKKFCHEEAMPAEKGTVGKYIYIYIYIDSYWTGRVYG